MKTSKQEMLKVIYEKIADKTLSIGCRAIDRNDNNYVWTYTGGGWRGKGEDWSAGIGFDEFILGHPVMIGDVLDWIYSNFGEQFSGSKWVRGYEKYGEGAVGNPVFSMTKAEQTNLYLCAFRSKKGKPIDDQSDECIEFVYQLVQGE